MRIEETLKEKRGRLIENELNSFFKHHDRMRESHYKQCIATIEKIMER